MSTILLLVLSNIFMTHAWYGHLKYNGDKPLWVAILVSRGIAFFESCLMTGSPSASINRRCPACEAPA